MSSRVLLYDTTLRDGAQGAGLAFTVRDKLHIAAMLDDMGVDYIEAGDPSSGPKDAEFFRQIKKPAHAKLVAFGATHRAGIAPQEDPGLQSLLDSGAEAVCIFGKSWSLHATEVLGVTPEENLELIRSSIRWLKEQGREVFFDAEHFFDGWKHDRSYAIASILAAKDAGASCVTLCDTNGGVFPQEVEEAVADAVAAIGGAIPVGMHAHNDCGMADANAIIAVQKGAVLVQGTLGGLGERCGNAPMASVQAMTGDEVSKWKHAQTKARLYSFRIYETENGVQSLVHEYLPYKKGDVVGLYDTVTRTILTDARGSATPVTIGGKGVDGAERYLVQPLNCTVSKTRSEATLTANASGAVSYKWTKNGAAIVGGENGELAVSWVKNGGTDTYTVTPVYDIYGREVEGSPVACTVEHAPMGLMILLR